ncbi:MAG TPA: hypothetical protein VGP22_05945, partial [Albitalea sp.]|nr:hypothetical protein [Albitalea sp.]
LVASDASAKGGGFGGGGGGFKGGGGGFGGGFKGAGFKGGGKFGHHHHHGYRRGFGVGFVGVDAVAEEECYQVITRSGLVRTVCE